MQQNQSISHSQTLSFLNRRLSVPCEGGPVRGVMWNGRRGGFYERFMFSWFGSDLAASRLPPADPPPGQRYWHRYAMVYL